MIAILAAIHLALASPSSPPEATEAIQYQKQPTEQDAKTSPSIEGQKTKPDQGADEPKNNQHGIARIFEFVREHNAEVVALSTAIMGVFTVILSIATVSLWLSGRAHTRQELRAYVFLRDIQLIGSDSVIAYVRNWGKTPAYDFRLVCTLTLADSDTTEFRPNPTPPGQQSISTLGPGQEQECLRPFAKPLTEDQFAMIAKDKLRIFVFGRFDYTDAFGKVRFTNFRYFSTPIPKGDEFGLILNLSSTGNESN